MKKIFCLLISLSFFGAAYAQTFGAGIHVGLNGAQINGDESSGFNKLGMTAGVSGITYFNERLSLHTEILFSQRGSRNTLRPDGSNLYGGINLNYVEVPVLLTYRDWLISGDDDSDEYYKVSGGVGLSYGRLINSKIINDFITQPVADNFNRNDFSWLMQVTYQINSSWGATLRYTGSQYLSKLYDTAKHKSVGYRYDMVGYFLTLRLDYTF